METATGSATLGVRSRQITSRGGWSVTEFTVYCPFRRRSVDLDECEECHAHEATNDLAGAPAGITCHRIARPLDVPEVADAVVRAALERTPLSQVMSGHVVCVHSDLPLRELPPILLRHRISGLPVVDNEFRPIGVVTKTDLIRYEAESGGVDAEADLPFGALIAPESATVAEVMTPSVSALGERASVVEASQLMATRGVHRVLVTAGDGRIVGMVSSLDVLRWLSRELPTGEGVAGAAELD